MPENRMRIPNYALWPMRTLGSLSRLISRGNAPSYVEASGCLAIGQRCVTEVGFNPDRARPHDLRKSISSLVPEEGDILVNSTGAGTIGRSCLFPGGDGFVVDSHVTLLRVRRDMVDPRWVNALLRSEWGQAHLENQCYSGSTNQVELSRVRLSGTFIPLPSIVEQRKAAEALDSVDSSIRVASEVIAKRERIREGVADGLFSSRESWEQSVLNSFLVVPPKNGFSPSEVEGWTGVRVLGLGCLTSDGFSPRQLKSISPGYAGLSSVLLEDGDLLISRANTRDLVGLVGRYRDIGGPCLYPDLMMRLRVNHRITPDFMERSLRHPYVRRQIMAHAVGTSESMVKISSAIVRNLRIAVPSKEEQHRIVSIIEAHDERIAAERARLEKLRKLKAGLMDDLLTGRVRVDQLQDLPV